MHKLWHSVLLVATAHSAQGQSTAAPLPDSVKSYLDKSLTLLQTYSLERNDVDWPQLRQMVYQKVQGAQNVRDLLPVYPFIFKQLKDDHG
jgi:carboxyl-terminal processing protease